MFYNVFKMWMKCGNTMEKLWKSSSTIFSLFHNMELKLNVELVWEISEFQRNEKLQKSINAQVPMIIAALCALIGHCGVECSFHSDMYTASALERIDHLRLLNSLKLLTYLILTLRTICVELVLTNRV